MNKVEILKVEISNEKNLLIKPIQRNGLDHELFEFIYRMSTGVFWDKNEQSFSSPIPKSWSYVEWFKNIVHCAKSELGVALCVTQKTIWVNISDNDKVSMGKHIERHT